MKRRACRRVGIALRLLLPVLAVAVMTPGTTRGDTKIVVPVGQSATQLVRGPLKTVSIADTEVADVVVASPHELLVIGKKIGFTTLMVWDEADHSTRYSVVVRSPFSDQQIELSVKVAELNRSKISEYGLDFLYRDEEWTGGDYAGEVATPRIPLQIFSGSATEGVSLALRYVTGDKDLSSMIHALQQRDMLQVLAEPRLVAASGNPASFLSGGEIPVPIASSGAQGGTSITVEWKEFGVRIEFVPTIVDSGVINLAVAPEVSSLDFGNGIVLSGFRVPALRVRRAETTVELRDGEILVIGGLLITEVSKIRRRIPILGHIPLVGLLFSNVQNVTTHSELVVVVSPRIIRALPKGTPVALPGQEETEG